MLPVPSSWPVNSLGQDPGPPGGCWCRSVPGSQLRSQAEGAPRVPGGLALCLLITLFTVRLQGYSCGWHTSCWYNLEWCGENILKGTGKLFRHKCSQFLITPKLLTTTLMTLTQKRFQRFTEHPREYLIGIQGKSNQWAPWCWQLEILVMWLACPRSTQGTIYRK